MVFALEVKNLHKTYRHDLFRRNPKSLNGLSLGFKEGFCTGLMGHNGAGKTTTIRIILGLIFADKGQVKISGEPIASRHRRTIGYMPEANQLPRGLKPMEVLRLQLKFYQKPPAEDIIMHQLEIVGLVEARNKLIHQLSKGMQRRLAWAMATIHDPTIIILDEPFSGMDPLGRLQMHEWIGQLRKSKKTILLCTHEVEGIQDHTDEIHVIKNGKLVFSTQSEADLPTSKSSFFNSYKVCFPAEAGHQLPGIRPITTESQEHTITMLFEDQKQATACLDLLRAKNIPILFFGKCSPSRDTKFLDLFQGGHANV